MKMFKRGKRKGAITIFLTIILIPTMLFSAVLIDGTRVQSAKAMTQEATDLAAISALADYDQELKDEFGMFAIKDPENLEAISRIVGECPTELLPYNEFAGAKYAMVGMKYPLSAQRNLSEDLTKYFQNAVLLT